MYSSRRSSVGGGPVTIQPKDEMVFLQRFSTLAVPRGDLRPYNHKEHDCMVIQMTDELAFDPRNAG